MTIYKAPTRDFQFLFREVLQADQALASMSGFDDVNNEMVDMVIEEGAKFCEQVLHPLNLSGDKEGCTFDNGAVRTPTGFKQAYQSYTELGWSSLSLSPEYGGQGLPETLNFIVEEMACSSNTALSLYSVLTRGAVNLLMAHASDELKSQYLEKMVAGLWTGTMCLTESHAGTDLGMVKTKAVPQKEGTYAISGTKIFITGGEHDMTENIIHLVLARLPDAPEGVRGISLFLVPKHLPDTDGAVDVTTSNGVSCGSIEHKMGIKGSSTCVMNFDGATGFLIGEANKGLAHMFTMMNIERLAIGIQGVGSGEVAYQNAVDYARERLQSRALTGVKQPEKAADPIIVHPDIRRMLLTTRAYIEGCRALSMWTALQLDTAHRHPDESKRETAQDVVDLITPVVKAFFSDIGYETSTQCQQVFGGHGYIHETGMEQFVRDSRIAQIYEGTNGIQALDLVRRKLYLKDGSLPGKFFAEVQATIEANVDNKPLQAFIEPLNAALNRLKGTSEWLVEVATDNPDELGAAAVDYLRMFGLTAVAWMWVQMVERSLDKQSDAFYHAKVDTARFYFARLLPQIEGLDQAIRSGADSITGFDEASF